MKRILISIILVFITSIIFAKFKFSVSGTVINPQRNYVVFGYYDKYFLNLNSDTIQLNKDDTFEITDSANSELITAYIEVALKQSINIYCVVNQKLLLTVRDTLKDYTFNGNLEKINQYIADDDKYFEKIYKEYQQKYPDFQTLAAAHSDKYFSITDSITLKRLLFLESYFASSTNQFEQDFLNREKQELIYSDLTYKLTYNNPDLAKFSYYQNTLGNANMASTYMFSNLVTFNDTSLINNPIYLRFTRWFFMELVFHNEKNDAIKLSKEAFYDKLYSFVNQLSADKICNSIIKASFINDEVAQMWLDSINIETTYGRFVDSLQNCNCIPMQAKTVYNNFIKKLTELTPVKPGSVYPDCTLQNEKGESSKLEDLKGKIIYIDVWASWCGKCLEGMSGWNNMVDSFRSNNKIIFLTVSTDEESDKLKWLKLIKKFHINGLNLISTGGQNSEFVKNFYINSYPTNILLNGDGTIISLHAPAPNEIDLSKYLK